MQHSSYVSMYSMDIEKLAIIMKKGFDSVDARFDAMDARFDTLEQEVRAIRNTIRTYRYKTTTG